MGFSAFTPISTDHSQLNNLGADDHPFYGGGSIGRFSFDTSTSAADPGVGKIRFNNAAVLSGTQIFIDNENTDGLGVNGPLKLLAAGQHLVIAYATDRSKACRIWVEEAVDSSGYVTITYDNARTATTGAWATPANNDVLDMWIVPSSGAGGAFSIYTVTNTTTPAAGQLGYATSGGTSWTFVTDIYVHDTDQAGATLNAVWNNASVNDTVIIRRVEDRAQGAAFTIDAVSDLGAYTRYTVTNQWDNGPDPLNAAEVEIWLSSTAGGGDVTGPGSAVSTAIATFNGTTGKVIQNNTTHVLTGDEYRLTGAAAAMEMNERSAAPADAAAKGHWWVKDDVPNRPFFTDDTGANFDLTEGTTTGQPEFVFEAGGGAPSGTGKFTTNTTDITAVATINLRDSANNGGDWSQVLLALRNNDRVALREKPGNGSSKFETYVVTAVTDNTSYVTLTVTADGIGFGTLTADDAFELFILPFAGDVVGPASATDNALVRFDATTGKLIQDTADLIYGDGGQFQLNSATASLRVKERATGPTVVGGSGYHWVKNDVPNRPYFTDDTDVEHNLVKDSKGFGEFTYDSTTTAADPGAGTVRFNNATIASATSIYIDDENKGGVDFSTFWLNTAAAGDQLLIQKTDAASVAWLFTINSITDSTGYFTLTVTHNDSGSGIAGIANGDELCFLHLKKKAAAGLDITLASNEIIDVDQTEVVIGGGYLDGSTGGTYSWEVLGTLIDGGTGVPTDVDIRLYDRGTDGSPVAGTLRSTLTISTADSLDRVTQALTAVASPGTDTDEIITSARMYEVRAYLDATGSVHSASLLSVRFIES